MAMANTVEAKSLSTLTAIAANPPADLGQPAPTDLQPLTLYIARVPGSRDVFLTPMKPRQKVVTAEDIQSSLYFLHVHGPSDEAIIKELSDQEEGSTSEYEEEVHELPVPEGTGVGRKPLPSPASSQSVNPRPTASGQPHPLPPIPTAQTPYMETPPSAYLPTMPHLQRKPVSAPAPRLTVRPNVANQSNIDVGAPRPQFYSEVGGNHIAGGHIENLQPPANPPYPMSRAEREARRDKVLRELPSLGPPLEDEPIRSSLEAPAKPALPPRRQSKPSLSRANTADQEISITLIRRDPSSGEQWNVARITDPPVFEVTSDTRRNSFASQRVRKTGQPMYLEVLTPGYSKFAQASAQQAISPTKSSPGDCSNASADTAALTRRLWMEGSIFEKSSKHKKSLSADSIDSATDPKRSMDFRSSSELSVASGLSRDPVLHTISVDPGKRRSNTKGYTFMSPWNGRCEFSAGIGHTLKCRHSMSNQYLALSTEPTVVSELRFNLPGGGPLPSPSQEGKERDSYSRSRRSRLLGRRKLSEELVYPGGDASERLDLSLGQERAGGGFGGKQAKLGKLIIEVEGLKMLDLLVAANMSLWWRAYEKG